MGDSIAKYGHMEHTYEKQKQLALTTKQAAAHLGVHPLTLQKMLRAGRIKGVRAGRKWIVPVRSLEVFLEGGEK
jgi:excisionase family DNA binding protein